MDIFVKIDGDGQMDASLIDSFVAPIVDGNADYTKGNRFFNLEAVRQMPKTRLFGNAGFVFSLKIFNGLLEYF